MENLLKIKAIFQQLHAITTITEEYPSKYRRNKSVNKKIQNL
jgi:hypothetical protein